MKTPIATTKTFRILALIFVIAGAVGLGVVFWQLFGTNIGASEHQEDLVEQAREGWSEAPVVVDKDAPEPADAPVVNQSAEEATTWAPNKDVPEYEHGDSVAIATIDRLGLELPVLEGTDSSVIDQGVLGHYQGTGAPCHIGNFAVAGHRTTHGEPLRNVDSLQEGDRIVVEWADGTCVYEVQGHEIVAPSAVQVIAPVPNRPGEEPTEAWMTLTSCHPLYSTAERYIVYAQLVE